MFGRSIRDYKSLEELVAAINGPYDMGTSEEGLAAAYAIDAALDAGYGLSENNLDAHLTMLKDAGAKFDYQKALDLALKMAKNDR